MSEHTPGPWELQAEPSRYGFHVGAPWHAKPGDLEVVVCEVFGTQGEDTRLDSIQSAANARLIAAAPELLEACEFMMYEQNRTAFGLEHCLDKLRAAISAARKGER